MNRPAPVQQAEAPQPDVSIPRWWRLPTPSVGGLAHPLSPDDTSRGLAQWWLGLGLPLEVRVRLSVTGGDDCLVSVAARGLTRDLALARRELASEGLRELIGDPEPAEPAPTLPPALPRQLLAVQTCHTAAPMGLGQPLLLATGCRLQELSRHFGRTILQLRLRTRAAPPALVREARATAQRARALHRDVAREAGRTPSTHRALCIVRKADHLLEGLHGLHCQLTLHTDRLPGHVARQLLQQDLSEDLESSVHPDHTAQWLPARPGALAEALAVIQVRRA